MDRADEWTSMDAEVSWLLGPPSAVLRLLGFWRWGGGRRHLRHVVGTTLSLFVLSTIFFLSAAKLAAEPPAEFDELMPVISLLIASFSWTLKAAAFVGQQTRLQWLVAQFVTSSRIQAAHNTRARYRALARRVFVYTQVVTGLPMALWTLEPLVSGGKNTPLPAWLPLDIHATPTYELLCVFQVYTYAHSVQASICIDIFFVVLMIAVAAELNILNNSLREGRLTSHDSSVLKYKEKQSGDYDGGNKYGSDKHKNMYKMLVKNVQHHEIILKCVKELETSISYSIFVLLFLNMVIICIHVISTTLLLQDDVDPAALYKMVSTLPLILFQTGMFCIFGQMIIDQSEQLPMAAFSCGWLDGDLRFRRAVLLLMLRADKPLSITVCRMYPLSRHTFLQLLNGSYTIFNMVFQMKAQNDD